MLKKIAFAIALFMLPLGVSAQSYKFGHINAQEVITTMPEFIKAQSDLQVLQKKYSDDLKRTQDEFNKKYQEFMQQKDSLPQAIAERRQKELEDMAQRQQQFQTDAEQGMQKSQNEMLTPIYQKLDAAIKAVGQESGVIYVFDLARTQIPYVNETQSVNLTAKVKAKLGIGIKK
jgi:outer membrane protein